MLPLVKYVYNFYMIILNLTYIIYKHFQGFQYMISNFQMLYFIWLLENAENDNWYLDSEKGVKTEKEYRQKVEK